MDVCKYQKFGFCKFKDSCKNQHLVEICENLSLCANLKSCLKRHPRVCKSYAIEKFCKFQAGCAYHHKEENINNEMKNKVDDLEKMVNGLSEKIVQLENKLKIKESKESEVKEIKEFGKTDEHPNKVSNLKKNPITLVKKVKLKERKDSVFRFGPEARKTINKEIKSKEKVKTSKEFKCELCDYDCEKSSTLEKHISSKHTEQKCKVCSKDFKTSMELVSHVAKEHHEEEEEWDIKFQSTPNSNKERKGSNNVISESMIDDFLLKDWET